MTRSTAPLPGAPAQPPYGPPAPYPPLPPYAGAQQPYGPPAGPYGYPQPPAPRRRSSWLVAGAVLGGLVVLAGIAVGALLLFGTKTLNTAEAQRQIARITEDAAGVAPTDVSCPADIEVQKGATFSCTGTLDGQPVSYTVTQTDDRGDVHIDGDNTYVQVSRIEQTLSDRVGAQAGVDVTTSCDAGGRTVLVDPAGTQVPCTVTNSTDPTDSARFVATLDAKGNVSYATA